MRIRHIRAWLVRLAGLFGREAQERELAEELESHLQIHVEENIRAGLSPGEARRQALIKLGGVEPTKERYRRQRGVPVLEDLWQDLRFGVADVKNMGLARPPASEFYFNYAQGGEDILRNMTLDVRSRLDPAALAAAVALVACTSRRSRPSKLTPSSRCATSRRPRHALS